MSEEMSFKLELEERETREYFREMDSIFRDSELGKTWTNVSVTGAE